MRDDELIENLEMLIEKIDPRFKDLNENEKKLMDVLVLIEIANEIVDTFMEHFKKYK